MLLLVVFWTRSGILTIKLAIFSTAPAPQNLDGRYLLLSLFQSLYDFFVKPSLLFPSDILFVLALFAHSGT
jgi:hypothetical protein